MSGVKTAWSVFARGSKVNKKGLIEPAAEAQSEDCSLYLQVRGKQ